MLGNCRVRGGRRKSTRAIEHVWATGVKGCVRSYKALANSCTQRPRQTKPRPKTNAESCPPKNLTVY